MENKRKQIIFFLRDGINLWGFFFSFVLLGLLSSQFLFLFYLLNFLSYYSFQFICVVFVLQIILCHKENNFEGHSII